jgi:hypothetical protein
MSETYEGVDALGTKHHRNNTYDVLLELLNQAQIECSGCLPTGNASAVLDGVARALEKNGGAIVFARELKTTITERRPDGNNTVKQLSVITAYTRELALKFSQNSEIDKRHLEYVEDGNKWRRRGALFKFGEWLFSRCGE